MINKLIDEIKKAVPKAIELSMEDQVKIVNRHGGLKELKKYIK